MREMTRGKKFEVETQSLWKRWKLKFGNQDTNTLPFARGGS